MSNALILPWRIPCAGLRTSISFPSFRVVNVRHLHIFDRCSRDGDFYRHTLAPRPRSSCNILCSTSRPLSNNPVSSSACLHFRLFQTASSAAFPKQDTGAPFNQTPLSTAEVNAIFGRGKVSPSVGNRILAVLHGRRLSGTLDLDLPSDITTSVRQDTIERGLAWLRENVPVDEDAAIVARVEREEREAEEREEKMGRPQSGSYGVERAGKKDVWGKSALKALRQRNEARIKAEEELKRKEWLEGEKKELEELKRFSRKNRQLQVFKEAESAVTEGEITFPSMPVLFDVPLHTLSLTQVAFFILQLVLVRIRESVLFWHGFRNTTWKAQEMILIFQK